MSEHDEEKENGYDNSYKSLRICSAGGCNQNDLLIKIKDYENILSCASI